jgi:signal transduction histidine kinase/DNA-binding response OmpR family regulator
MKFENRIKQLENIRSKIQMKKSNRSLYLLIVLTTSLNSLATFGIIEYFSARNNNEIVSQIANSYTQKISDRLLLHLDSSEAAIDPNSKTPQVQSFEQRLDNYLLKLDLGYALKIALIDPDGSIIASNLEKVAANSPVTDKVNNQVNKQVNKQNIWHYFPLKINTFSDLNQPYKFSFKIKQQRFLGQAIPWQSQKLGLSWLVVTIPQSELGISSVDANYLNSKYAYVICLLPAIVLGILNYAWLTLLTKNQNESLEQHILPSIDAAQKIDLPLLLEAPNNQNQSEPVEEKTAQTVDCEPYILLADMSHELRSPLNAILGFAQIMEQELSTTEASQENIAIINRSGERLLSIINDVVDLAKIETNRLTLEDNSVDFYAWLDNIEQSFKFQAHNQGWDFSVIRQQDLPQWICIDERRLRQILRNLINYCLKSTPTNNVSLKVSCSSSRQKTIATDRQNSNKKYRVVFEVENAYLSFTPKELATLFDPLVTVREELKSTEGSSLNLPISRKLAQLMGGDITVSNNQLSESGIIFNLEIQTESVVAQKLQIQSTLRRVIGLESDQIEYRILIVDDSKTNRAIMKRFLEPVGFIVQEAVNGQEAIDIWLRWQPHMIWMDLRMPVMNGCEATRRIKSYPQTMYTPIVALSASTLEEDKSLFKAAGCDDFVGKPFSENVIFDKIAQHLGIRYVYESTTPSTKSNFKLTAETLNIMSSEWLNDFEQAAIVLDRDLLTQLLQKIPSEHNSLKNSLQKQVNDFDFDKIISLVKKVKAIN